MLSISAKAKYGVAAMFYLALEGQQRPIQIREIAEKKQISHQFLEQTLSTLKKAGLVKSFRGVNGGYALAKLPSEITIADVIDAVDGAFSFSGQKCDCEILTAFWQDAENVLKKQFQQTLQDFVLAKKKLDQTPTFSI